MSTAEAMWWAVFFCFLVPVALILVGAFLLALVDMVNGNE